MTNGIEDLWAFEQGDEPWQTKVRARLRHYDGEDELTLSIVEEKVTLTREVATELREALDRWLR